MFTAFLGLENYNTWASNFCDKHIAFKTKVFIYPNLKTQKKKRKITLKYFNGIRLHIYLSATKYYAKIQNFKFI